MNSLKILIAILVSFQYLFLFSFAQIPVSLNSSDQFLLRSSEVIEFIIDNSSNQKVVQFDLSIDINNSHNLRSAHFLLLICGNRIPSSNFIKNIVIGDSFFINYRRTYDIFMIDTDGLSLGSKELSVFYSTTNTNGLLQTLYVYALGPYKFGEAYPTYVDFGTESYQSSYSVKTQRTCQGNCKGHGNCKEYYYNLNYCQCSSGFVGNDCGVSSKFLVLNTKSSDYSGSADLEPGDKLYLKVDFSDFRNQFDQVYYLNIKSTNSMMMFSVYAEKKGKNDLTPDYKHWLYQLGYNSGNSINEHTLSFYLSAYEVQNFIDGQGSLVSLITEVSASTSISFGLSLQKNQGSTGDNNNNNNNSDNQDSSNDSGSSDTKVTLIIVLTLIGIGIVLLVIFVFVRKHLAARSRHQVNQAGEEQQIMDRFPSEQARQNSQENFRNSSFNVRLPPVQTYEQLINRIMPAQTFNRRLLNNFKQQRRDENSYECAICTEQFSRISRKVRKTICNHIFHDDCLIQWLERNQSCPLCRRSLTNSSLLSFQANPPSYQDVVYIAVFPQTN